MKQCTTDLIGKTITGIAESFNGELAIAFSDDTFTVFGVTGEMYITQRAFSFSGFPANELVIAGIMTEDEATAMSEHERLLRQARAEAFDRAEYARLSKKFGG